MSNEETVRRYCMAVSTRDHATAEALRHPDWSCVWPQSGERVTSSAAMREISERSPGGWEARERHISGSQDEFVVTPAGTLVRTAGGGEVWTAEWINRYPDGTDWYVIDIVRLRNGRVIHETTYWASPFEAPPWRRPLVQLGEPE